MDTDSLSFKDRNSLYGTVFLCWVNFIIFLPVLSLLKSFGTGTFFPKGILGNNKLYQPKYIQVALDGAVPEQPHPTVMIILHIPI